tara:strand:- start:726 stop:1217 length:492 start_codon:yes stop_codon:yes gene_type:complete
MKVRLSHFLDELFESNNAFKNALKRFYPINANLEITGICEFNLFLSEELSQLSTNKSNDKDFEISCGLTDVSFLLRHEFKQEWILGDSEKALGLMNLLRNTNINFEYLIAKHLGDIPALGLMMLQRRASQTETNRPLLNEDIVLNNIRAFALRLDRAERMGQS